MKPRNNQIYAIVGSTYLDSHIRIELESLSATSQNAGCLQMRHAQIYRVMTMNHGSSAAHSIYWA